MKKTENFLTLKIILKASAIKSAKFSSHNREYLKY